MHPRHSKDTRHSDVTLTIEEPATYDVSKDMTFVLHGRGYNPDTEPGASSGVYLLAASDSEWRIGECMTLTAPFEVTGTQGAPAPMAGKQKAPMGSSLAATGTESTEATPGEMMQKAENPPNVALRLATPL